MAHDGLSTYVFSVVRYNTDGSLDTSFDGDGKLTTEVGPYDSSAYAVAIQGDGKVVVAGASSTGTGTYDLAAVRYNTDGSLDTSFDGDGIVTTVVAPETTGSEFRRSVVIQDDGKIVVAGSSLVRYNTDGSLDTIFDGDGIVTTDFTSQSAAIQEDGKIVVLGYVWDGTGVTDALARYETNGSLDASFTGFVPTTFFSSGRSLAIQSDGKIVAAGHGWVSGIGGFAVARYLGDYVDTTTTIATTTTTTTTTTTMPAATCGLSPVLGCISGARSSFQLKDNADDTKDQIKWKWGRGPAVAQTDLGDPGNTTTYTLCIYDSTTGVDALVGSLRIDPNAAWTDKDPNGWSYKETTGSEDGVIKAQLKTGGDGKSKAQVAARGANVPMLIPISGTACFDQDTRVTVQLFNDTTPTCWTSEFTSATVNDGTQFKAKAP